MAIVEVKMVSGWKAVDTSLKRLIKQQTAGLKRYEFDPDNTVQFYFDSVSLYSILMLKLFHNLKNVIKQMPATLSPSSYTSVEYK